MDNISEKRQSIQIAFFFFILLSENFIILIGSVYFDFLDSEFQNQFEFYC